MPTTPLEEALDHHLGVLGLFEGMGYDSFWPMLVLIMRPDHNGRRGVVPILLAGPLPEDKTLSEVMRETLRATSAATANQLDLNQDGVEAMVVHADSYVKGVNSLSEAGEIANSVAQLGMEDPTVSEALRTYYVTRDGTWLVVQRYRWTPTDGWEWDAPLLGYEPETEYTWKELWR